MGAQPMGSSVLVGLDERVPKQALKRERLSTVRATADEGVRVGDSAASSRERGRRPTAWSDEDPKPNVMASTQGECCRICSSSRRGVRTRSEKRGLFKRNRERKRQPLGFLSHPPPL